MIPERQMNTLSYSQRKKLDAWLCDHWEDYVEKERPTYGRAAAKIGAILEFTLTDNNVRGIVDQMGREWPAPLLGSRDPSKVKGYVDPVARRLLAALYRKLGEAVPEELGQYLDIEG